MMSVSRGRIFLIPSLSAALVSQIVTLPILITLPSTTSMGTIILLSCHEPHRRARIPHKNETSWIKKVRLENGFLACLLEPTQTNGDKLSCRSGAWHVLNLPCAD